ncbi:ABC transporter ATP-binding protein [Halalkalibacter sp. APA_J-10(15)]|uniref:ABC transporter ATP-binding protein n=1 Tax=unclassified Halalkalibacter TaxID=2893063 RepID=UPI001FF58867|nr:ABC transporter ATP-binding protein [Halalkalibacter sp. APA_J-10(15)]MCK0471988.1 ABC transporter ATP-binding protein [Halalkalibacter sp. APA_J-10(15)]
MEIRNVDYSYQQRIKTLSDISMTVPKGQITTIIGPNGSGKSTLLQLMSRHLTPGKGEMLLDGKNISLYSTKEFARKIAVVHQQNDAPNDMTVERLIEYGRLPYKKLLQMKQKEDYDIIAWALKCTNLEDKKDVVLNRLSGGERQRVWIAMALAQKTNYLFLDEPTTYLDLFHQYEILELITQLNQLNSMTIVMVLHDLNQAIKYSDQLIIMKDGAIVKHGKPAEVMNEQIIKEIYRLDVLMKSDKDAGLYIVPIGV